MILVSALIFANQMLFNVYVIRVHNGDASFVSRYVPAGWFEITGGGWMRHFAAWFPAPRALSFTVLRAQAFLELPFGLATYLTVARWLDPALMRRLLGWSALACASVAYTIVFCLIEADLANPYTRSDIVVRAISGVVTPLVFGLVLRSGDARPARSAVQVLAFAASAGALGALVLVAYDTVLLYNLGRVGSDLPIAVVAAAALAASRWVARRVAIAPPPGASPRNSGPCLDTLTIGASYALLWFFVPALPIRYTLLFGAPRLGLALGALIAVMATFAAVRQVAGEVEWMRRWLLGIAATLVSAALCGGLTAAIPTPYSEARLLSGAAVFVVVATLAAAVLDRRFPATSRRPQDQRLDRENHAAEPTKSW